MTVSLDGVTFFGSERGALTVGELQSARVSTETQLHIVRHLTAVSVQARLRLHPFADDQRLTVLLQTLGSKFHPSVNDPVMVADVALRQLALAIEQGQRTPWVQRATKTVALAMLPVSDVLRMAFGVPEGEAIGVHGVIALTSELMPRVERHARGGGEQGDTVVVNVVRGVVPPASSTVMLALQKDAHGTTCLISVYPGMVSPPLPRPQEQSPEKCAYNAAWWQQHAFLA